VDRLGRATATTSCLWVACAMLRCCRVGEGVRRRDVWRGELAVGRRSGHVLGRGHERRLLLHVVRYRCRVLSKRVRLVVPPRVRVVVDARMAGELVRAREAFGASRELACMRLLARVSADVPGLMFQSVEGFGAERALVRSGEICWAVASLQVVHRWRWHRQWMCDCCHRRWGHEC